MMYDEERVQEMVQALQEETARLKADLEAERRAHADDVESLNECRSERDQWKRRLSDEQALHAGTANALAELRANLKRMSDRVK